MHHTIPWIEKYRPVQFDTIVLDPLNKSFFQNILRKRYFPNLLLYGPPGTGKTTTIMNLIHEYQNWATETTPGNILPKQALHSNSKHKENIIHLNASDERGIDIIRNQINQFVKTNHLFEPGLKFVILDEVDYMTKNAQQALKSLLQMCRVNVRFCLICNYISKIDESLQHEFICVRFNQLPRKEISQFIRNITDTEGVSIRAEDIDTIQTNYQSDIRSMINFIQLNSDKDDTLGKGNISISHRIIGKSNWEKIHWLLGYGEDSAVDQTAEQYIHRLSIRYNMDKRNILNTYLNYVIRNYPEVVSPEFLSIAENVVHTTDDVPTKHLLFYFCANLSGYYRRRISGDSDKDRTEASSSSEFSLPSPPRQNIKLKGI